MRFHVLALPHTQVTRDYNHCAYTEKVRKFCDMMTSLGHEVYLYASEDSDANHKELVTCITKHEQRKLIGIEKPTDNLKAEFKPDINYWQLFNRRAILALKKRLQKEDFICVIAGLCHKQVADAFPAHMTVEFGIGYGGVFSPYKVFESYAWMHTVYGAFSGGDAHSVDGNYFDTVIPNYYDPKEFPFEKEKEDYFLYIGRLTERKGFQVAVEVCQKLGKRLVVAGQGEPPEYGEYVGVVGPQKRGELMSKAQAVFVPTQYVEPFGGVSAEAMLCGTPVITTDWGAFVENNQHNVTGFRCRSFKEFLWAAENVHTLNYAKIHNIAVSKFSMDVVKLQYEQYFERLLTLWSDGWYDIN